MNSKNHTQWIVSYRNNELMLDLNFSEVGQAVIKVDVIDHIYKYDNATMLSKLILSDRSRSIQISMTPADDYGNIYSAEKLGYAMHIIINAVGWISLSIVVAALFIDIDLMAPMIEFIRMTKPLSRFKYIDVQCGGIIEGFLANYHDLFRITAFVKSDTSVRYSVISRDRLLRYHLPVFVYTTIPDKYIIYAVDTCN